MGSLPLATEAGQSVEKCKIPKSRQSMNLRFLPGSESDILETGRVRQEMEWTCHSNGTIVCSGWSMDCTVCDQEQGTHTNGSMYIEGAGLGRRFQDRISDCG